MSETRYEFGRLYSFLSNSLLGWSAELIRFGWNDREPRELQSAVARVEALQGRMGESTRGGEAV